MKYKYEPAYCGGFSVLDSTKEHDAAFIAQVPTEMKAKMIVDALNSVDSLIVAANTVVGCYARNPSNFASALRVLEKTANAARAQARPSNCRNRLRDEGKPYPRSGCNHCKTGGLTGCPFEGE